MPEPNSSLPLATLATLATLAVFLPIRGDFPQ
jgi:hypothetical protein